MRSRKPIVQLIRLIRQDVGTPIVKKLTKNNLSFLRSLKVL